MKKTIDIENKDAVKDFFQKSLSMKATDSYLTYLRNAAKDTGKDKVSPHTFYPIEGIIDELIARNVDKKRFSDSQSAIRLYNKFLQVHPEYLPKIDNSIKNAWKSYFKAFKEISELLDDQSNILGTIAERLCAEYFNAKALKSSSYLADLKDKEGWLYQVKARMVYPEKKTGAPLSAFRKNDDKDEFNCRYLIVILFNKKDGSILQVLEYDLKTIDISPYKKTRKYQNADIINFSKEFEGIGNDITIKFKQKVNWL